eukprot:scaffold1909_cov130-Cylindrotheca_fusiformis.AAC.17
MERDRPVVVNRPQLPSSRRKTSLTKSQQDEAAPDDNEWYPIFSPPGISPRASSRQKQQPDTERPWYSIFSQPEDHILERKPTVPKGTRRQAGRSKMAPSRRLGCEKKDFHRSQSLQAVLDRVDRRRRLDRKRATRRKASPERQVSKSRKRSTLETEEELLKVLKAVAKYDKVLQRRISKDSSREGFSDDRDYKLNGDEDIEYSKERVPEELHESRKAKAKKFLEGPYLAKQKERVSAICCNGPREKSLFFTSARGAERPSSIEKPESPRRANIRLRRERLQQRKRQNGLNTTDVGSNYQETSQQKEKDSLPTPDFHHSQEFEEGKSSCPVDLTRYPSVERIYSHTENSEDEISNGPTKQARELKAHVDTIYQHSQNLLDTQQNMKNEIEQIKSRYSERQKALRMGYSKHVQGGAKCQELTDQFSWLWKSKAATQFEDDGRTEKQLAANFPVENGVIVLDNFKDNIEELSEEEGFDLNPSPFPRPIRDPPSSRDPRGYHVASVDDRSDTSPEPAVCKKYRKKEVTNIPRYLEEQYEVDLEEEARHDSEEKRSGSFVPPFLQPFTRRQPTDDDSDSSASQSMDPGSIAQFSKNRTVFWDCGAGLGNHNGHVEA